MADGKLEKLVILAFDDPDRQKSASKNGKFTVMFNPITFNRKYEIEYFVMAEHASPKTPVYSREKPQEYDFEFTIDGTGASNTALTNGDGKVISVAEKVEEFWAVCGEFRGDLHRPPYLTISWGKFALNVILKTADISYTLFNKDGSPLRAKITATFGQSVADEEQEARDAKSSPDLSHVRTVIQGDVLPLMTKNIYGESASLYLEIAKFNRLNNFRKLKSGTKLIFPPIDKSTL